MSEGLPMWTIYERPRDYPAGFVVRRSVTDPTGCYHDAAAQYAPDLASARALVPPGLQLLPRFPDDDPVIVEVWL